MRNWKPPSEAAKAPEIFKTQVSTREDVIRDGHGLDLVEIPIRIYHYVYAHFHRTMSTPFEVLDFNQTELDRASVLLDLFSAWMKRHGSQLSGRPFMLLFIRAF